jgi:hypothetical protein
MINLFWEKYMSLAIILASFYELVASLRGFHSPTLSLSLSLSLSSLLRTVFSLKQTLLPNKKTKHKLV